MNRRNSQTDQQIQVFRVHANIRWETRFRGQEEHRHGLGYMQEIESQHNDQEHHLKHKTEEAKGVCMVSAFVWLRMLDGK